MTSPISIKVTRPNTPHPTTAAGAALPPHPQPGVAGVTVAQCRHCREGACRVDVPHVPCPCLHRAASPDHPSQRCPLGSRIWKQLGAGENLTGSAVEWGPGLLADNQPREAPICVPTPLLAPINPQPSGWASPLSLAGLGCAGLCPGDTNYGQELAGGRRHHLPAVSFSISLCPRCQHRRAASRAGGSDPKY